MVLFIVLCVGAFALGLSALVYVTLTIPAKIADKVWERTEVLKDSERKAWNRVGEEKFNVERLENQIKTEQKRYASLERRFDLFRRQGWHRRKS